jgi:transposase
MLQLTPQSRIFLAVAPIDGRKGIDGLAAVCRQVLGDNPLSGAVYVFRNRTGTTLKLLAYDGQGFWLCTKRLSHRRFLWWPTATTASVTLSAWALTVLLGNGDPDRAQLAPDWRPVRYDATRAAS